jgi:hypothetical protein
LKYSDYQIAEAMEDLQGKCDATDALQEAGKPFVEVMSNVVSRVKKMEADTSFSQMQRALEILGNEVQRRDSSF